MGKTRYFGGHFARKLRETQRNLQGKPVEIGDISFLKMRHSGKILARLSCLNAFIGFFHVDANYFDIVLDVRTSVRNNERGT